MNRNENKSKSSTLSRQMRLIRKQAFCLFSLSLPSVAVCVAVRGCEVCLFLLPSILFPPITGPDARMCGEMHGKCFPQNFLRSSARLDQAPSSARKSGKNSLTTFRRHRHHSHWRDGRRLCPWPLPPPLSLPLPSGSLCFLLIFIIISVRERLPPISLLAVSLRATRFPGRQAKINLQILRRRIHD